MATSPEIPLDIRQSLHDCILAVFWPKKQIVDFFQSVSCPVSLLPSEASLKDSAMSRHSLVIDVFSKLLARPDRGYTEFQAMIDRMSNWSYFDPYYFETMGKLDKSLAESKISDFRRAVSDRNGSTQVRREASTKAKATQAKAQDLTALTSAFSKLFGTSMTAQARGRLFEVFLKELFDRQSIKMGDPFNIVGEQIDGSFKFEGENYIVEAKWQDPSTSTGDLYKFAHKVDGKMYGRGIFISVNGYSHESIRAIVHGKHIQTILIDGQDLSYVLEQRISLEGLLDYKIRAAQTRGEVYVCSVLQRSKDLT